MKEYIIPVIMLIIQCGALKFVYDKYKRYCVENDAQRCAVRSLLKVEMIDICYKAQGDGYIKVWQMENLTEMFEQYTTLGGNGTMHKLYEKTISLPQRGDL